MTALGLLTGYGLSRAAGSGPSPGGVGLIQSFGAISTTFGNETVGWQFTVGATPLTARALRVRMPVTASRKVSLWERTAGTLLATVTISAVTDTWVEAPITPVTLAATGQYIVGVYAAGGDYATPSNTTIGFDSRITYNYGMYAAGDARPVTSWAGKVLGMCDVIVDP